MEYFFSFRPRITSNLDPTNNNLFIYREFRLKGVGFRCVRLRNRLFFKLGFSHYLSVILPSGIFAVVKKNRFILFALDPIKLGYFVDRIRYLRFPDIYKAKGINLTDQVMVLKVGKRRR